MKFHLGPGSGHPPVKKLAENLGLDFSSEDIVKRLMEYFVTRVNNITHQHGLDLTAWEDGLMGIGEKPYERGRIFNRNVYANAWDSVWEFGVANRPYKLEMLDTRYEM